MFLVAIPAIAAMLPGVDLTPKLAIVPLLNVSLLCKSWSLAITTGTTSRSFCVDERVRSGRTVSGGKNVPAQSVLFRS
jgi:hypothetical protein